MASSAATAIIDAFAKGSGGAAFPNITRKDVVDGLRERVDDASKQNQSASSLCGCACLLYCVLNDSPELYVRYVVDLYTTGAASLGSLSIKPSKGCRNYKPTPDKIAAVDWIALASLRDSENTVLDYESAADDASGVTMPGTMVDWFKALGYKQIRNVTNVVLSKGRDEVDSINKQRSQGRWVCLFINSLMLDPTTSWWEKHTPNHWVVAWSDFDISGASIYGYVYSWGKINRVPALGKLTVKDFCKNFYGTVGVAPLRAVAPPPPPSPPGDYPRAGSSSSAA